jgi:hypothetical protein
MEIGGVGGNTVHWTLDPKSHCTSNTQADGPEEVIGYRIPDQIDRLRKEPLLIQAHVAQEIRIFSSEKKHQFHSHWSEYERKEADGESPDHIAGSVKLLLHHLKTPQEHFEKRLWEVPTADDDPNQISIEQSAGIRKSESSSLGKWAAEDQWLSTLIGRIVGALEKFHENRELAKAPMRSESEDARILFQRFHDEQKAKLGKFESIPLEDARVYIELRDDFTLHEYYSTRAQDLHGDIAAMFKSNRIRLFHRRDNRDLDLSKKYARYVQQDYSATMPSKIHDFAYRLNQKVYQLAHTFMYMNYADRKSILSTLQGNKHLRLHQHHWNEILNASNAANTLDFLKYFAGAAVRRAATS